MKFRKVFAFVLCLATVNFALAETAALSEEDCFGGPTSIGSQLELDDEPPGIRHFEPWFSFKRKLRERTGFDFSIDYAILYQHADKSLTENDDAFGGVFRIFGKWELLGRETSDTGSIVWKVENRGRLGTDVAPGGLGDDLGYLGSTAMGFTDVGWFLAPLYWEQYLYNGNVAIVAGRIDSLDFGDISGYSNLWRRFQNNSLLYNSTIPYPQVGVGAGAGFKMANQWFFGATIHDANGVQTEFDFLVDGSDFFKQAYVSWAPTRAQRFDREVHLTVWHADERSSLGIDDGWGLALSGNWLLDGGWMPFMRAGWADGESARADASVIVGMLYHLENQIGELGAAWGWESLSNDSLGDQQTAEVFFRWDVLPNFAITPSLQVLINPALNPTHDKVFVAGLRARVNF